MKNLLNYIDTSEKNRILEMHKKRGYNTVIVESPMDSMFYPGDDYTKDMGNSVMDTISTIKEKIESMPMKAFAELPNPEKIINNVNNFFGGDVTKMDQSEIENVISRKFNSSNIGESSVDKYDDFKSPHSDEDAIFPKLKDIKGGLIQKILSFIGSVFGLNVMTFGMMGTFLSKILSSELPVNPAMSMVISVIAAVIIYMVRKMIYFKNRNNEE